MRQEYNHAATAAARVWPVLKDGFPEVDGKSDEVRRLKDDMSLVARDGDVTVLIVGESGTGKERVARAIHRASPRSRAPFVVIDCAGLSPSLAEDALFGHTRGAFTGAIGDRPGPFERADGGTVLLDEVGELTLDLQLKLLRAIQARTVQRLGSPRETAFDVRVIASTNVDLARAVSQGRFREDLYYRLNVYEIVVPPVRNRGAADIALLVDAVLTRAVERRGRRAPAIDPDVLDRLVRYHWPGNVRQIENTVERMIVAAAGEPRLTRRHLPDGFGSPKPDRVAKASHPRRALPASTELAAALQRNDASLRRTAADLGLSRHQLYRLRRRFGIAGRPEP